MGRIYSRMVNGQQFNGFKQFSIMICGPNVKLSRAFSIGWSDLLCGGFMIRCSMCQKNAVPMTKYMHWLKLCNFIEFLYSEQYIEQTTHDDLQDSLQTMKNWAFEENDEKNIST